MIAIFLLSGCSSGSEFVVEISLSDVDSMTWSDLESKYPAAIEAAYDRYHDRTISVTGVRSGPGMPDFLGSHQYVGLHQPPKRGEEFLVYLIGNVPPKQGGKYRIRGKIIRKEFKPFQSGTDPKVIVRGYEYKIRVIDWEEINDSTATIMQN